MPTANGLPYTSLTDAPNLPAAVQSLAEGVDSRYGLTVANAAALSGISSPYKGMSVFLDDVDRLAVYTGSYWRVPTFTIVKTSDESVTSSTTLQNDDALQFSALAGATYGFDLYLNTVAVASTVDIKVGFAFPTGTLSFGVIGMDPAVSAGNTGDVQSLGGHGATSGSTSISVGVSSAAGGTVVLVSGSFVCTTAGTVSLMWAQNTSTASALTVRAGSKLRVDQV